MRYETNSSDFDFPKRGQGPSTTYVIASTPRSGSNMLQRGLWRTGLAGAPEEYLASGYLLDFDERWAILSKRRDQKSDPSVARVKDLPLYISRLFEVRTSPNGVFGLKLHADHMRSLRAARHSLEDLLGAVRVIWIRRASRERQAISWLMAIQTDVWIEDGAWLKTAIPSDRTPEYDAGKLEMLMKRIEVDDLFWADVIGSAKWPVLTVTYEDLVGDFPNRIDECLRFLGVDSTGIRVTEPGIRRQAGSLNEEWLHPLAIERGQQQDG